MTLPSVLNNFERKRNAVILKRAYSDLANYVNMYKSENDCLDLIDYCQAPKDDIYTYSFVQNFSKYLRDKQKFTDAKEKYPAQIGYFANGKRDEVKGACNSRSVDNSPGFNLCYVLISPTGEYAYVIDPFPSDVYGIADTYNWQTGAWPKLKPGDYFRGYIWILTDQNYFSLHTSLFADPSIRPNLPQMGRNLFQAFVMNSGKIIPNGYPTCYSNAQSSSYYCKPLGENNENCSNETGTFNACLMKIINDGWEIKYPY